MVKCLILAAGKGTRLSKRGVSKPLISLLGLPLIERVILTAQRCGISDFYVVTGYRGEKVRPFLDELSKRKNIKITYITNDEWDKENGISVLKARPFLHEKFILLMCDHIFDESILLRLMNESVADDEVMLAVDYKTKGNKFVDLEDVTKVQVDENLIVNIGKNIEPYNAFDTGIFLCSPALFDAIEKSLDTGDNSLSGGIRKLAEKRKVKSFNIKKNYWIDVDDERALKKAKNLLFRSLTKPTDGIIARHINRKFSSYLFTPILLKLFRGITPNQVSIVSFLVGIASSVLFFLGHPIFGALLIQFSSILDGSDGEIARLKHMESSLGNFIDAILDRYADSFILLGMFYYSLMMIGNETVAGIFWTPLIISIVSVIAIMGNLMVSYTSAKSILNFGYRYSGRLIAAGKGRDIRLFILFIGGLLSYFHPIFVLLALCIIAILSNTIVIWRTILSWNYARRAEAFQILERVRAVIFDFDGTLVDSMSFLTHLATALMKDAFDISEKEAMKHYLETSGFDFASQMELLYPNHPKKEEVITTFEARKLEHIFSKSLFPDTIDSLKYFKGKGIKTFIISSTKEEILFKYCKLKGLDTLVFRYYGFRSGFTKNDQQIAIFKDHKFRPAEVLFVGDSLKDYDFAKENKIKFIGISRIFSKKEFKERGAFSVSALFELVKLFKKAERYHVRLSKEL